MRDRLLSKLIWKSRGKDDMLAVEAYGLEKPQILVDTAREFLANIPPSFGACALMSAGWVSLLREKHGVPAVAVAGDLSVLGAKIFRCTENLPEPGMSGKVISKPWDGHCWVEVGGYIGDLSLFRTAYATDGPSRLREFVMTRFGPGRGALISKAEPLYANGLNYKAKYVLNDRQLDSLVGGLRVLVERYDSSNQ